MKVQGADQALPKASQDEDYEEEVKDEGKTKKKEENKKKEDTNNSTLHQMHLKLEESNPIFSVSILRDMFINGKIEFIMKVLVQLNKAIVFNLKE